MTREGNMEMLNNLPPVARALLPVAILLALGLGFGLLSKIDLHIDFGGVAVD
jgi:hypothetical protein